MESPTARLSSSTTWQPMRESEMAKTSIAIYKKIDQLTKKAQKKDLPFLIRHYFTLKALGIKDDLLIDLFNHGLLAMTLEETINGLKG